MRLPRLKTRQTNEEQLAEIHGILQITFCEWVSFLYHFFVSYLSF